MKPLPLVQQPQAPPAPRINLDEYQSVACSVDQDGCLTCGDVAVPVTVSKPQDQDALCVDAYGNEGRVALELVGEVSTGDRLLVHAGVAIERLEEE